jgi:hypothetical protein
MWSVISVTALLLAGSATAQDVRNVIVKDDWRLEVQVRAYAGRIASYGSRIAPFRRSAASLSGFESASISELPQIRFTKLDKQSPRRVWVSALRHDTVPFVTNFNSVGGSNGFSM